MKKRFLILFLFLSGCMGPAVGPDLPDNTDKADPALVQECRLAFGEFGKADAVEYGNLYLAFADLIQQESDEHQIAWAVSWLEKGKLKRGLTSYPGFREIVIRETSDLKQNEALTAENREKIWRVFKRLGLAAREAGR